MVENNSKSIPDIISDIKLMVTIPDILAHFGISGKSNSKILCPFPDHQDSAPSFHIHKGGTGFKCFGCGRGGDVIDFVQYYKNTDWIEAFKACAEVGNIPVPETNCLYNPYGEEVKIIKKMMRVIAVRAKEEFRKNANKDLYDKFKTHYGFKNDDILEELMIGYIPNKKWLYDLINEYELDKDFLLRIGFVHPGKNGRPFHLFDQRITFPYLSGANRNVVYFAGRRPDWSNGKDKAKYHKQYVGEGVHPWIRNDYLYNEFLIHPNEECILTEGYTDSISGYEHGFNIVSMASLSIKHSYASACIRKLKRCRAVYISNDSEKSGRGMKGAETMYCMMAQEGLLSKIVKLPLPVGKEKEDLNSFFMTHNADDYRKLLNNSKYLFYYKLEEIKNRDLSALELDSAIKELGKFIPPTATHLEAAASEVQKMFKTFGKVSIKTMLKDKALSLESSNKQEDNEIPEHIIISKLGKTVIVRAAGCYGIMRKNEDNKVYIEEITNFVMDVKEIQLVVEDTDPDGDLYTDRTYYDIEFSVKGYRRKFKKIVKAQDLISSTKLYEACMSSGISIHFNTTDPIIRLIVSGELDRCKKRVHFLTKMGKVGPYYISGNYMKYEGKKHFSDTGDFELEDGRRIKAGHPREDAFVTKFCYEEPFPMFVDTMTTGIYKCWGISGLLALAWLYGSHHREVILQINGSYPVAQLTGKKGSGKSVLCRYMAAIAGNSEVIGINSTTAAITRMMDDLRCLPIVIDEFRTDAKRDDLISLFRAAYDGTITAKANRNNQHSNVRYKPMCSILLSGEEIPSDEALYSRIMDINMLSIKLDKKEYINNLLPNIDKVSYLYYDMMQHTFPDIVLAGTKMQKWGEMIKEAVERIGGDYEDRYLTNFGTLLFLYDEFIRSKVEGLPSNEEVINFIAEIIKEKRQIQSSLDPVMTMVEFIKDIMVEEDFEISRYVAYRENEDCILLRINSLLKEYNKRFSGKDKMPLQVMSIKNQLKALGDDVVSFSARRNFYVNDIPQRFSCIVIKADCKNTEFRELANTIKHLLPDKTKEEA